MKKGLVQTLGRRAKEMRCTSIKSSNCLTVYNSHRHDFLVSMDTVAIDKAVL